MATIVKDTQLTAVVTSDKGSLKREFSEAFTEKDQTLLTPKHEDLEKRAKLYLDKELSYKDEDNDREQVSEVVNFVGHPLVWSENRQALCDATPYFKSHQGGLYTRNNLGLGLLIDGAGFTIRDRFGADVIVTTMGGGRKLDANGNYSRQADHLPNSLKVWQKNQSVSQPLVVIAGINHPEFPCRAVHRYSVLDNFWVTDIWPERYQDHTGSTIQVFKVRLEKVHLGQTSWWWDPLSENATNSLAPCHIGQYTAAHQKCEACEDDSKQVFSESWTCLNVNCPNFFTFPEGIDCASLTYSREFLGERTAFSGDMAKVAQIVPDLPSGTALNSTSINARAGIVCPECGCCSRRRYWNRWECENNACDFALHATLQPHSITDVENETSKHAAAALKQANKSRKDPAQSGDLLDDVTIVLDKTIHMEKHNLGSYKASIYVLPNAAGEAVGCVVVYRVHNDVCGRPGGPNALYTDLQNVDMNLHRNAARCGEAWNEVLTRHFQQNFGAPYKFGVVVASKSFEDAPDPVLKCLARLQWAGQTAVKASDAFLKTLEKQGFIKIGSDTPINPEWRDFNELLALGYMEKDEISYHDDGEKELGPTVATLSLGSPSKMSFRPKKGSNIPTARGKKKGNPEKVYHDALQICLKHGDMVVMHGAAIHRDYEHAVEPLGQRRFALTSRVIRDDSIGDPGDREIAMRMGTLPDHYSSFEYDGDIQNPAQAKALVDFTEFSDI